MTLASALAVAAAFAGPLAAPGAAAAPPAPAPAAAAAKNADWTGHWTFTDTCISGVSGCPGVYVYEIDFVQRGGSVTGTGSPYTSTGTASGRSYTFTVRGSRGYTATFRMTMSCDGKSATGTATDSDGRKFTITASGNGTPGAHAAADRVLIGACPVEKTQEQKDAATDEKRTWEDRYIFWGGLAAVFTGATAYAGSNPVTLAAVGPLGFLAAGNGILAWWASSEATYWGRVAEDPPDRNWRRIARPAATHPERIALPRTLSKRTRTAAKALIASQLRSAALARCIAQAIDRGTTALPKNARIAARQYAAGATCAREKARRTVAVPRLVAPLVRFLRPYDARILAAAATAPRGPAFRRLVTRNIAALAKAAGLTRAERTALTRRILTAPAPSPAVAPSAALALAGAQAKKQAAETRQVARALAAAASGT
ncbi:MAG: hypothetical protein U0R70_12175 [Solirubrobacteraceae bacterium]